MDSVFEVLGIHFLSGYNQNAHTFGETYSFPLLTLSYAFAVAGSYVGLLISQQISAGKTKLERAAWLVAGAAAMGGGVWSMHFIGMMTIQTQMNLTFDAFLTAMSLLPCLFASAVVLHLLSKGNVKQHHILLGGVLIGAGISTMHFIGMAAMRMNASIEYHPYLFALSIFVAVFLAVYALNVKLWIEQVSSQAFRRWANLFGAATMGAAITGMHYTAMAAVNYLPGKVPVHTGPEIDSELLIILANGFMLALMVFVSLAAIARKTYTSSALIKLIINNSTEGFLVYDHKGVISLFSPGAATMFDRLAEDVIGMNVNRLLPGEVMGVTTSVDPASLNTVNNGATTVNREITASDKNGRTFPMEISISRITIGHKLTFCATLRDITARKEMDYLRDCAHRELEGALKTQKKTNQVQRDFVTMASHEFRTPLAIIDGGAQRILRRQDSITAPELEKRVIKIRDAVTRMVRLMESFLAAAKSELGSIELSIREVDFGGILAEICSETEALNATHKIELTLEGFPETSNIDSGLMTQAITNLLSNAIKYSPQGDLVEVRGWSTPDEVHFSVRDYGLGISADEIDKVSSRFFRASTAIGIPGTGIGLSLTRHIVEQHGGSMAIESEVDIGTTFTVTIPTTIQSTAVVPTATKNDLAPGTSQAVA